MMFFSPHLVGHSVSELRLKLRSKLHLKKGILWKEERNSLTTCMTVLTYSVLT